MPWRNIFGKMNKIFAIGDIHGRFDLLKEISEEIIFRAQKGDTIVVLGDYIDRGPQSKEVIEALMDAKDYFNNQKVVILKGNHEDLAIQGQYHG